MTDCIHVNGIRAFGYIGVLPEEQSLGQWFTVDLTLWRDLQLASVSDRLEDTYNYCAAVESVQTLIQTSRFALIERLAGAIAEAVLQSGDVQQVRVKVTKQTPPIAHFDGTVSVEITRS